MPQKHSIKTYVQGGVYHVYNRGVEKRNIFLDDQDYRVFLNLLKESLLNPTLLLSCQDDTLTNKRRKDRQPKTFFERIMLLAYCCMPNHFHLMIKQCDAHSLDIFIKTICTRYAMYFNKKYHRVGKLFQSSYKAILIMDESYFLHLSRYIHRNPAGSVVHLEEAHSSYAEYLGIRRTAWINTKIILALFRPTLLPYLRNTTTYQLFVESTHTQDNWIEAIALGEEQDTGDTYRYRF
jgi:putative transposase